MAGKSNTLGDVIAGSLRAYEPRHVVVARQISGEIVSGRWPTGSMLPPEPNLCALYKISRYGIRRAIDLLQDLGLVSRRQGIGTTVLATRPRASYTQAVKGPDDLVQYIRGTRPVLLSRELVTPSGELMQVLATDARRKWLRLVSLRFAQDSGPPFSFSQVYVHPDYVRLPNLRKTLNTPIYAQIEQHYQIRMTRVEQVITATMISGEHVQLLQLAAAEPGLRIVRKYYVKDTVAAVTIALHPMDRFSYSTVFELDHVLT